MSLTTVSAPPSPPQLPALRLQTSYRGAVMAGLLTVALAFGGLGTWAALAPLGSAAIAQGVVTVSSNRKQIQHLEGGIVGEILVKDGDVVQANDVLMRLDRTRAQAQVDIVTGQLNTARAVEARLVAERDRLPAVVFPAELVALKAGDSQVAAVLAAQEKLFEVRRAARAGQVKILQQRIAQSKEQIVGFEAQATGFKRQADLIKDELEGTRELYQKGYAARTRVLALEREAARLYGERGERLGDIARTSQAIGEAELQILQIDKQFQEEVATTLRETQSSIYDLRERLAASNDVLVHTEIRAPEGGVIVGMSVHTIGAVITPGRTIMEIVPSQDNLIVEARLQPSDIDHVTAGMEADVHFSTLKQSITPVLNGVVLNVSADRLVDDRTLQPYYLMRISVSEQELEKLEGQKLIPGMPADVYVKTGERTALRYLTKPLTQVLERSMREH